MYSMSRIKDKCLEYWTRIDKKELLTVLMIMVISVTVLFLLGGAASYFDMKALSESRKARINKLEQQKTEKDRTIKHHLDTINQLEQEVADNKEIKTKLEEHNTKLEELKEEIKRVSQQRTRARASNSRATSSRAASGQESEANRGEDRGDTGAGTVSEGTTESGRTFLGYFKATAYNGAEPNGGGFTTASGTRVGPGTIAVDRSVIPLGTRLYVEGYGEGKALDTGGAIKGARIDVWLDSVAKCNAWGVRTVAVYRIN